MAQVVYGLFLKLLSLRKGEERVHTLQYVLMDPAILNTCTNF